jgi:hypothetical protein
MLIDHGLAQIHTLDDEFPLATRSCSRYRLGCCYKNLLFWYSRLLNGILKMIFYSSLCFVAFSHKIDMRSPDVPHLALTWTLGRIKWCQNACVALRPLHSHIFTLLACPYICRSMSAPKLQVQWGRSMSSLRKA